MKQTCDWCAIKLPGTAISNPHPFKGTGFFFCSQQCVDKMEKYLIRCPNEENGKK